MFTNLREVLQNDHSTNRRSKCDLCQDWTLLRVRVTGLLHHAGALSMPAGLETKTQPMEVSREIERRVLDHLPDFHEFRGEMKKWKLATKIIKDESVFVLILVFFFYTGVLSIHFLNTFKHCSSLVLFHV